jgi:hypothetical protein
MYQRFTKHLIELEKGTRTGGNDLSGLINNFQNWCMMCLGDKPLSNTNKIP